MATLGGRLANARRTRGITQTELAVALGDRYSQSMISQVETGRSSLLLEGLANAAKELGVSTDYLLGLSEDYFPRDAAQIPQVEGIPVDNLGNVVRSKRDTLCWSSTYLVESQVNPLRAGFVEVRGQSMYPTMPHGSIALVDLQRQWLNHNLIYLIVMNAWTPNATYEIRRLRWEDGGDQQWHTDSYLDLKDAGWDFRDGSLVFQDGERSLEELRNSWPANSWRRDIWRVDAGANFMRSRSEYLIAPISHDVNVRVVGQVRGVLLMYGDDGW